MNNNPYALSVGMGRKLFGQLNTNSGMPESVMLKQYDLRQFFNLDRISINGDKITYYGLENADDVADNDPALKDCEGAQMICVGSRTVEIEVKRDFDKIYQFDTCRVRMGQMNFDSARNQLNIWQRQKDRARLLYEIKTGIGIIAEDSDIKKKDYQVDGTKFVNVVESMEQAVTDISEENPEVALSEYQFVISNALKRELNKMKIGCCDFLQGYVPAENTPQLSVRTVAVPTSWLAGNDYILYIKRFAPYHRNCYFTRWIDLANEHDGWIGYHIRGKWDVQVENFDPAFVTAVGYKGKILASAPADSGEKVQEAPKAEKK